MTALLPSAKVRAQGRPWCDSGVSAPVPDTSTTSELKTKLASVTDIAGESHPLSRLQPVSLSIVLSGTVQPYSVVEERDEDITFCLQLDDVSRKQLQRELGNPSRFPAEIHVEIVAFARDRRGNTIFRGWQKRDEDRVLFNGEPIMVERSSGSIRFKNLAGQDKHLDGKQVEVTGSLVVDRHWDAPQSRCGMFGCLEIHPVSAINVINRQ
jgi:hypothetical protein